MSQASGEPINISNETTIHEVQNKNNQPPTEREVEAFFEAITPTQKIEVILAEFEHLKKETKTTDAQLTLFWNKNFNKQKKETLNQEELSRTVDWLADKRQ